MIFVPSGDQAGQASSSLPPVAAPLPHRPQPVVPPVSPAATRGGLVRSSSARAASNKRASNRAVAINVSPPLPGEDGDLIGADNTLVYTVHEGVRLSPQDCSLAPPPVRKQAHKEARQNVTRYMGFALGWNRKSECAPLRRVSACCGSATPPVAKWLKQHLTSRRKVEGDKSMV